ncbi:MAG: DUF4340 domain-containing protein, partial [Deltaproteobacteria bacterium]|nr:DUF4340 domain-containing protein [Deltaproteobacteria bacterium]
FGTKDKPLATLLIGSSPGFRKVHARLASEPLVFDIPFSSYQASLKAADWVDRQLLQLKKEQIRAIVLPDCRLLQKDGTIRLAKLAATEQTDSKTAGELFNRLSRLQILDVVGNADGKLPETDRLTISIERADGKTRQYQFARNRQEAFALLKVSDGAQIYKVSGALLKELQQTTRQQLLQTAPPEPAANGS